jgi:hypothetical protein
VIRSILNSMLSIQEAFDEAHSDPRNGVVGAAAGAGAGWANAEYICSG